MNTKGPVGILDYGAGNVGSVQRAIASLSSDVVLVSHSRELQSINRLIFPGVGSARQAMTALKQRDLIEPLKDHARSGRPLLGICVGMQVLGQWSDEGDVECLGLLPYHITKFETDAPVPHMGWNSVEWETSHSQHQKNSSGLSADSNFYFVHSYAAFLDADGISGSCLVGSSQYAGFRFANFVAQGNVWGSQCHVEKSGRAGMQYIQNFLTSSGGTHA